MKSSAEVSKRLDAERKRLRIKYVELAQATGLSVLAVRQALQGTVAMRVSNLIALADQLELEVILVPKLVAQSLQQEAEPQPKVLTDIEQLLTPNKN